MQYYTHNTIGHSRIYMFYLVLKISPSLDHAYKCSSNKEKITPKFYYKVKIVNMTYN